MIHAETHQKNHVRKHFADGQLTTATKFQYKLYTHIHRLHEIMLVVVQHMSKTKYVITCDYIISRIHRLHEIMLVVVQHISKTKYVIT